MTMLELEHVYRGDDEHTEWQHWQACTAKDGTDEGDADSSNLCRDRQRSLVHTKHPGLIGAQGLLQQSDCDSAG